MRFLRLSEIDPNSKDRVFRYSVAIAAAWAVALICIAAAVVLIDWEGRRRSGYYVAYYVAGVLLLGLLLYRRLVVARLLPSNWLARIGGDGLYLQIRSYLNYHFPAEDQTVVFIPYREIRSARLVRSRVKIADMNGGTSFSPRRLVEFELAGDVAGLSNILAAEFAKPAPPRKTWYGTSSTLYGHYPVRMSRAPFVQVEWPASPSAASFLDALRPYTRIAPAVALSEDFADLYGLNRADQEKRLTDLDRRGHTIAAIYMARRLYGYDLAEAKAFVTGLRVQRT